MYLYINFSCHVPHNIWNHWTQPEWPTKKWFAWDLHHPHCLPCYQNLDHHPSTTHRSSGLIGQIVSSFIIINIYPKSCTNNVSLQNIYIYIGIYTNIIYIHTWQLITTHWGYQGCGQTMIYPDSSQHKWDKQPTLDNSEPRVGNVPNVCVFLFCLGDDKKNVHK